MAGGIPSLLIGIHDLQFEKPVGLYDLYPRLLSQPLQAEELDQFDSLKLSLGDQQLTFQLGAMSGPLLGLRKCMNELVKIWGYAPEKLRALRKGPVPRSDPRFWIQAPSIYAKKKMERGEGSLFEYRLDIDATGAVKNCVLLSTLGSRDFAEMACNSLQKRAKFKPAIGPDGERLPSFMVWAMFFNPK